MARILIPNPGPCLSYSSGAEDILELDDVGNDESLLLNFKGRFRGTRPYTFAGRILVAVHPCMYITPSLYDTETQVGRSFLFLTH